MASDTTDSKQITSSSLNIPNNMAGVQLDAELLKAAKSGNWSRLGDLIKSDEGALVPEVIVNVEVEDGDQPPPAKWPHAYGRGSVLHVVASGGDDENFLMSATVIYGKAKHLLGGCNADDDTPLHCAARSGSVKMLYHLIDLASREGEGGAGSRLQVALRKLNCRGETALHEAVRWGDEEMVRVLLSADGELARFPGDNGSSPLYLAILLGHDDIAEQLYGKDNQLSYSGPDGQNALHVAVLRSERMTKKLLAWNKNLTKQGDRSNGRTPLHYAALWGYDYKRSDRNIEVRQASKWAKLLFEADESSAYQSDVKGLFPIHMAALGNNIDVVRILLQKCPDCAELRDAQGRTFVHIAVSENSTRFIRMCTYLSREKRLFPKDACKVRRFASVMNAQDNEGNTALHLAAMAGQPNTMLQLIWTKEVQLNLQNKKAETALDLSLREKPSGVFYGLDPNIRIYKLLKAAGARYGVHQGGEKEKGPALNVKNMAKTIKDSTTTIGVVSVLIITVSFAAAFQVPGGYSTGNNKLPEGTPELAKKYSFEVFLVANDLALLCATMATISLMYAGVSTVDISTRMSAFVISIIFLNWSARSLAAAFAFGTYAVLAPVAHAAALVTWLSAGFLLIDIAWFTFMTCQDELVLLNRTGIAACVNTAGSMVFTPLGMLWPYVVIAGFTAYLKTHGIK